MKKNNWIENCLGFTNKKYTTPHGNGECVPQHKLNDDGKMCEKKDENGKTLTTNIYLQIQTHKEETNYKKLINDCNFDLEKVSLVLQNKNPSQAYENIKDFTNFGDIQTLKSMENKIINTFGSYDNFNNFVNNKVNAYKNQVHNQKKAWEKYKKAKEIRDTIKNDKENEKNNIK